MRGDCRHGGRACGSEDVRRALADDPRESRTTASGPGYAIVGGGGLETGHPLLTDRPIALSSAEVMPRFPPLVDRGKLAPPSS
jgi:hypothetical protein